MNERIKEMYNQCFVELENDTPNIGFDFEKFAQLIVQECADVAKETRWAVPPSQEQIARGIQQHFGVEE